MSMKYKKLFLHTKVIFFCELHCLIHLFCIIETGFCLISILTLKIYPTIRRINILKFTIRVFLNILLNTFFEALLKCF